MKSRLILTAIWILGFVASLSIIELYVHTKDSNGLYILVQEARWDCWRPLIVWYASYLAGILSFWFVKPLPARVADISTERARLAVALTCTLIFLATINFLLAQGFMSNGQTSDVQTLVGNATSFAKVASFLVAPANLYFFGVKASD